MLLEFLIRVILPEQFKDTKLVLTTVMGSLKKNTDWLCAFSMKHHFCWGVLAVCCSKISISRDDLSWARHRDCIDKLCEIFFDVCKKIDMPKLLTDSTPDLIQQHPSKYLKRYAIIDMFMHNLADPSLVDMRLQTGAWPSQ
jgi:hypothetical protein